MRCGSKGTSTSTNSFAPLNALMVTDSGAASEEAAASLDAATEDTTELAVEEEAPQAVRTPAALTAAIAVKNERREIFFIRMLLLKSTEINNISTKACLRSA